MSGSNLVLIDSSSWVEALRVRGDRAVGERVKALLEDGRACWCDVVILELWHGARGKKEREVLSELQRTLTCFEVDKSVWNESLKLASKARDAGITVPTADLVIAACAFKYRLMIEHVDKHLTMLEQFRES